jgi:hypothetical protein
MPDLLPGFTYAVDSARYRSTTSGRFVARREIIGQLDAQIRHGEQRLANLTTAYHEGRLSASVWTEQMSTELRRLHLQSAAQGAGGWDRMTQRDFGRVGGKLQADYRYLTNFAQDIKEGRVTLPQALNRANLYAGNARTQFWAAERDRRPLPDAGMIAIERRQLSAAEHCTGCIELYGRGWQLAGTLPIPGDGSTPCRSNDKCILLAREVPVAELQDWLSSKR